MMHNLLPFDFLLVLGNRVESSISSRLFYRLEMMLYRDTSSMDTTMFLDKYQNKNSLTSTHRQVQ